MSDLIKRLRCICDDCIRAPANRNQDSMSPFCTSCQRSWEAAAEIERLRELLLVNLQPCAFHPQCSCVFCSGRSRTIEALSDE
jgi:hypothetical protein